MPHLGATYGSRPEAELDQEQLAGLESVTHSKDGGIVFMKRLVFAQFTLDHGIRAH